MGRATTAWSGRVDGLNDVRILYLTPFPPRADAPQGGARALAHLLDAISDRHEVGLLSLHARYEPPLDEALGRKLAHCRVVTRPDNSGPLLRRVARGLRLLSAPLVGRPTWAEAFRIPEYEMALRRIVGEWRPDVVQIDYHIMAQYGSAARRGGAPLVIVEHEPGVLAARHRVQLSRIPRRWWYRFEARAWNRFEREVLSRADAVVVFTDRDRDALSRQFDLSSIHRIPLTLQLPHVELTPADEEERTILFIGSFRHPPNVDAARRLMDRILPEVRKSFGDVRLELIGPDGPSSWRGREREGIDYRGFVQDPAPHIRRAAILVAPLRSGGGMRVKVLEGMAFGKALVASATAMEGIGARPGEHYLAAENDREFAARIVELLADAGRRRAIGAAARRWVLENVNVSDSVARYEALYRSLVRPEAN